MAAMTDKPDRQDDGLLREIGVLINEFDASNSDWAFRKRCLNELLDKLRATPPSRDAAEGAGEAIAQTSQMIRNAAADATTRDSTVQPNPAPAGMRPDIDRMIKTLRNPGPYARRYADFFNEVATALEGFERSSPAPVPPSDALRQNADRAHDELYGFASVPPADGARRHLTDDEDRLVRSALAGSGTMIEELPSPAAAAEPFAWVVLSDVTGNTRMWTRNGDIAIAFAAKHLLECVELYRSPSLRVQPGAGERHG